MGTAGSVTPRTGTMWVIVDRAAGPARYDLLDTLGILYTTRWPASTTDFAERIADALHNRLGMQGVRISGGNIHWQRASDGGPVNLWGVQPCQRRSRRGLNHLEDLAYTVLAADPVDVRTYRRWRGVTPARQHCRPLAAQHLSPRSDLPPGVHRLLDPWMACYRRSHRAVGPYWLVPFLCCVLASDLRWDEHHQTLLPPPPNPTGRRV